MKDYNEFCDDQANLQNPNDDIEMSPNTEQNINHHMALEPPDYQSHYINLSEQNPNVNLSPLNQEKKEQNNDNVNQSQNKTNQNSNGQNYLDNENVTEVIPYNYDGEEKLDFYPELPNVEVNRTNASYHLSEVQASETNENNMGQTQLLNFEENTADATQKKNS